MNVDFAILKYLTATLSNVLKNHVSMQRAFLKFC